MYYLILIFLSIYYFINTYVYNFVHKKTKFSLLRWIFTGSERILPRTEMSKCHFLNDTFLYRARSMIFTMVILFSWKSGHVILHHKSESFNYDIDNDDKQCVISVSRTQGGNIFTVGHFRLCSKQDTHWWWLIPPPGSIFIELMLSERHRASEIYSVKRIK